MTRDETKLAAVRALVAQGDYTRAKVLAMRAAAQLPASAPAAGLLAIVLYNLGELSGAEVFARRAAALAPADPGAQRFLAMVLSTEGKTDEAIAAATRALTLNPGDQDAAHLLGTTLADAGRYAEAARALQGVPGDGARSVRANALLNLGRATEAARELEGAQSPELLSQRALTLQYDPKATPDAVFEAHLAYGHAMALTPGGELWKSSPARSGPCRVGLLSPDLRTHSVAWFLLPWLERRSRQRLRVTGYYTNRFPDATTARLRALCDAWSDMGNLADEYVARAIAADGVDVLIDLSGHTAGHSLGALRWRPARVQATYLGYPATTGLADLNVRLVDSITDPPGSERWCTERLVRLDPCFLCYSPPPDAPSVAPPAPDRAGPMTFGSFNAAAKLNDDLLALWARVLHAVPGSRLCLKSVHVKGEPERASLAARFAAAGGDPGRLDILPPAQGQAQHLAAYANVDIALDTYPYHGTTTTLEALWMGVPVVTLVGGSHVSRVGASLLRHVEPHARIATTPDGYIAAAANLASDAPARARARRELRDVLMRSCLCDAAAFASRMDEALLALAEGPP